MPQKLTTTACFIQEESSGGKQFRKYVSCFYAQGGNVGVLSLKQHAFLSLFRLFTWNLFLCWQAEIISDLLFSKQLSFSFKISSFSSKHKLHFLDPPV